jgi:FKBP-type peptidyl-prolyl cis-trans isomerase SlyD
MSEVKNKVVSISYNLYKDTEKGEMIESTEGKDPLVFLTGLGQMIPEFEANVSELNSGDAFSFGIKSEVTSRYVYERGKIS